MSTVGKGGEQPSADSAAPVATQHQFIPDATGGLGIREHLMRNVREATEAAPDPAVDDGGQPGDQDAPARRDQASQREGEPPSREQPKPRTDDPNSRADALEQQYEEEEGLEAQEQEDAEQPDADEGEGLVVDGQRFTPDDIRELIAERENSQSLRADYTRKTQRMSRVRQEHEALGTHFEGLGEVFQQKEQFLGRVVAANLEQFQKTDTSQMTAEQFEQFKRAYAEAKRGTDMLVAGFQQIEQEHAKRKREVRDKQAQATVEMLKWHETRWDDNNQFYAKLREFAVGEGLLSEAQFNDETDYLRMRGLIAMMDAFEAPAVIEKAAKTPKPPRRSRSQPRTPQGQFQKGRETARQNVLESRNAKGDGSLREMLVANLEAERR